MTFQLGANSLKNRAGIDPRLIEITDVAIMISPIDWGIPSSGGWRTTEIQAALYTAGKSKCDGRTNKSRHQSGMAVDVFAIDPETGKASWDKQHLSTVACAMLQAASMVKVPLEWGGLWDSWQDYPHFNLVD